MSKTISFDKIPLGAMGKYEAPYFYHPGFRCVEVDLARFWDWETKIRNFLFGPFPKTGVYFEDNDISEIKWRSSDTLLPWSWSNPSVYLGFICDFTAEGTEEEATQTVLATVNDVINKCPSDNVLIFGHQIIVKNSQIIPQVLPTDKNKVYASILCGFLGQ